MPEAVDGEVDSFIWVNLQQLLEMLIREDFKPNSALVTLQFLVLEGLLTRENCEEFELIEECLRLLEVVKGLTRSVESAKFGSHTEPLRIFPP